MYRCYSTNVGQATPALSIRDWWVSFSGSSPRCTVSDTPYHETRTAIDGIPRQDGPIGGNRTDA